MVVLAEAKTVDVSVWSDTIVCSWAAIAVEAASSVACIAATVDCSDTISEWKVGAGLGAAVVGWIVSESLTWSPDMTYTTCSSITDWCDW